MTDATVETKLYDVHLFQPIRRKICNVAATDQLAAIKAALDSPEFKGWLRQFDDADKQGDDTEDSPFYLVDEVGDVEYERSRYYDDATNPLLEPLRQLVAWHDSDGTDEGLEKVVAEARRLLGQVFEYKG